MRNLFKGTGGVIGMTALVVLGLAGPTIGSAGEGTALSTVAAGVESSATPIIPGVGEAPLTPDQVARIDAASALADDRQDLIAELTALPGYGGLHLDGDLGLVISVTEHDLDEATTIAAGLASPDLYEVRTVQATARELWDASDLVWDEAAALAAEGVDVVATAVTFRENKLLISATGASAHEETDALVAVPFEIVPPVQASVLTPPEWVGDTYVRILGNEVCTDRGNCTPLRSGLRLLHEYGAAQVHRCTSAFSARDAAGRNGLLTAGHCSQGNGPFTHGPFVLGPMVNEEVANVLIDGQQRFVDAGFIRNDNDAISTTPRVYVNESNRTQVIEIVDRVRTVDGQQHEAPLEGDAICLAGDTTGNTCGLVGPRGPVRLVDGRLAEQVACATTLSEPGDSGAGMYRFKRARGLNWGMITGGTLGICGRGSSLFTPIVRVERALGVTVNTH